MDTRTPADREGGPFVQIIAGPDDPPFKFLAGLQPIWAGTASVDDKMLSGDGFVKVPDEKRLGAILVGQQ